MGVFHIGRDLPEWGEDEGPKGMGRVVLGAPKACLPVSDCEIIERWVQACARDHGCQTDPGACRYEGCCRAIYDRHPPGAYVRSQCGVIAYAAVLAHELHRRRHRLQDKETRLARQARRLQKQAQEGQSQGEKTGNRGGG